MREPADSLMLHRLPRVDPAERIAGLVGEPKPAIGAVLDVEGSVDLGKGPECPGGFPRLRRVRVEAGDRVRAGVREPDPAVVPTPDAVRLIDHRGGDDLKGGCGLGGPRIDAYERVSATHRQPDSPRRVRGPGARLRNRGRAGDLLDGRG